MLRFAVTALTVLVLAGGAALPAAAEPSYFWIAGGDVPARTGAIGLGGLQWTPDSLAVRSDGVVAFATGPRGELFWVQGGRLTRILAAGGEREIDVAFAPDGTLVFSICEALGTGTRAGTVWRVAPGRPRTLVAGRPGRPGFSGDGGPATAARLSCPDGVAVQPDGGVLIADVRVNRVRRVGPDGIIQTVAGSGRNANDGDGGPAVHAGLIPLDVAVLPDGGFAIADRNAQDFGEPESTVRVVDAQGTITTRSRFPAFGLAAEPSGALLAVGPLEGPIRRLAPNGALSVITDPSRETIGIPTTLPIAGDPYGNSDIFESLTVAPNPDGGVLFGGSFEGVKAIRYLPPAAPSLLAVAILPATRVPSAQLKVDVRTTRPARVSVGVWTRGHRVAAATADVPGGDASVPVTRPVPAGLYSVRVRADGDGQAATANADVLVGGRLPIEFARRFIASRLELFRVFDYAPRSTLRRCRRAPGRRVDCEVIQHRRCAAVVTIRVQNDGTLAVSQYQAGHGHRCRFRS
jgi:hypothetical protein